MFKPVEQDHITKHLQILIDKLLTDITQMEEELWEVARKPVTDFSESIGEVKRNVDRLVDFYIKHVRNNNTITATAKQTTTTIVSNQPTQSKEIMQIKDANTSKEQSRQQETGTNKNPTTINGAQSTLSPLACAKLELAVVFAINTCYWLCLVTHGEDPKKSEIIKQIERIRLFMDRAKEVEESVYGINSSVKRPKIDKEASKRLCMNNMTTLKSNWNDTTSENW